MQEKFLSGINVNGQPISKVADPQAPDDAATKSYADTKLSQVSVSTSLPYAVSAYGNKRVIVLALSAGNVTLPTAVGNTDMVTVVALSPTVTVLPQSGQTIVGDTSATMPLQYMTLDFVSTGSEWVIV